VSAGREAILEATLRVIEARGADAVTHRAVAAEAGVSPALTTYHFASKEALVAEALELVVERSLEQLRGLAPEGPISRDQLSERLTGFALAQLGDRSAPLAAQFELILEAARRPALQPLAERWDEAYSAELAALARAAELDDPALAAEVLSAVLEGALMAAHARGAGEPLLRPLIRRAVDGL
jgi:DNA-binding transcriptional regulator YbjK